jgi:hypothetical protein
MNVDEFLQEARTMSQLSAHPNVIRLVGFCRDETLCILSGKKKIRTFEESYISIVTIHLISKIVEFVGGGSLYDLLINTSIPLKISQQLLFMVEISRGMSHLHKHNIIHRYASSFVPLHSLSRYPCGEFPFKKCFFNFKTETSLVATFYYVRKLDSALSVISDCLEKSIVMTALIPKAPLDRWYDDDDGCTF